MQDWVAHRMAEAQYYIRRAVAEHTTYRLESISRRLKSVIETELRLSASVLEDLTSATIAVMRHEGRTPESPLTRQASTATHRSPWVRSSRLSWHHLQWAGVWNSFVLQTDFWWAAARWDDIIIMLLCIPIYRWTLMSPHVVVLTKNWLVAVLDWHIVPLDKNKSTG